jgi:RES domain-containing protein
MLVYRITLSKYADALVASGNEGRWNSRGLKIIYTAGSRSLACLENLVHRSGMGLNGLFSAMIIEIPDQLTITEIGQNELPEGWTNPFSSKLTRSMGDLWYRGQETAILKIPSAIIPAEHNYIINTIHPSFKKIKLLRTEPFLFDNRLPV